MALSTVSNALQSTASEFYISNFDAHVLAVKQPPSFFKLPSSSPRTQSAPRSQLTPVNGCAPSRFLSTNSRVYLTYLVQAPEIGSPTRTERSHPKMATARAPKQWCLTRTESINSFENWKSNLIYVLSLDQSFAPFLADGVTWKKRAPGVEHRGFTDDGEGVPAAQRRTAAQKAPNERPEDLYQRLTAAVEDNLLTTVGNITHHGEAVTTNEEVTPSLENMVVLLWLRMLHPDLPSLVKQRYGAELRHQTLASIKPEISLALTTLLDELRNTEDIRTLRIRHDRQHPSSYRPSNPQRSTSTSRNRECPLCTQSGRSVTDHFLSQCPFLPDNDKQFILRSRRIEITEDDST
ncbi:hypothetical protein Bbelb_284770 [Branchiostoma belcheri]|nr:hypothetical protein Bbelb_284770 [Branchiostoma belcheri]